MNKLNTYCNICHKIIYYEHYIWIHASGYRQCYNLVDTSNIIKRGIAQPATNKMMRKLKLKRILK
jgi:hypothetical protein